MHGAIPELAGGARGGHEQRKLDSWATPVGNPEGVAVEEILFLQVEIAEFPEVEYGLRAKRDLKVSNKVTERAVFCAHLVYMLVWSIGWAIYLPL